MSINGASPRSRHSRDDSVDRPMSRSRSRSHLRSREYSDDRSPSSRDRSKNHSISRSRSRSAERRSYRRSQYSSSPRDRQRRYSRSPSYIQDRRESRSRSANHRSYRRSQNSSSPRDRQRRYSRSPSYIQDRRESSRGRGTDNHEDPRPNRCLGVFGLSQYTTEREIRHIFSKYGTIDKVQIVLDAKTGRSRGFAFVYYDCVGDATEAKNSCSGMEIDGRKIRVDYSITERPHTPTPGKYMGRPTYFSYRTIPYGRNRRGSGENGGRYSGSSGGYGGSSGGYGGSRRSHSPYHSKGRSHRSRSRSYSPRRYNSRF